MGRVTLFLCLAFYHVFEYLLRTDNCQLSVLWCWVVLFLLSMAFITSGEQNGISWPILCCYLELCFVSVRNSEINHLCKLDVLLRCWMTFIISIQDHLTSFYPDYNCEQMCRNSNFYSVCKFVYLWLFIIKKSLNFLTESIDC